MYSNFVANKVIYLNKTKYKRLNAFLKLMLAKNCRRFKLNFKFYEAFDYIKIITYFPPNSCIPRRAKTSKKRNNKNIKDTIDLRELIKDTTKFRRPDHALKFCYFYQTIDKNFISK